VESAAPILVSQATAKPLLGWSRKRFIKFVTAKGVRHVREGRLYVARLDDVLGALGLAAPRATAPSTPEWSPDDVVAAIRGVRQ
jgi:hypothetical protein